MQNTQDNFHNLARQETAHEATKLQITVRFLKMLFVAMLEKNMPFSTNTRTRCRGVPKRGGPRGAQVADYCTILANITFDNFF